MTQSLESLNFIYLEKRTRPYKCTICNRRYKSPAYIPSHAKSHKRGGDTQKYMIWTQEELNIIMEALLQGKNAEQIIGLLPERTASAVMMKLSGLNQAIKAASDKHLKEKLQQYSVPAGLYEFIKKMRREGHEGFDLYISQKTLRSLQDKKPTNGMLLASPIVSKQSLKETKIDELLRTIDETFDSLKDSFADLVDEAVKQKVVSVMNEKDKKIKEQHIEIAALTSVVEAAKQSSLVARLRTKLSGGA